MAALKLYNSLTRQKETFEPLDPAHVKMYACGPTVYNYAHIGNARMAVVFDLWARVLRRLYKKVTYVSNITDIEDKIITASRETDEPISTITLKYEKIYNEDMGSLGVRLPDVQPRATEHIAEMITLIEQLIARGHAYAADGHVLFDVPSYDDYGRLSGRSRDEQIAGARVDVAPYKKDPADFVLWKPSSGDEPGWESPWGFGRPGWHIECSAMAEKHLSLPFDIHGGGADLKFPHHENEIAQSCCAHGAPVDGFAKYWVHNGFVTVEGEKMSKSLGNFLLVHDLIEKYPGEVLRLTLLSAHYRQPLDWSEEKLRQSDSFLTTCYKTLQSCEHIDVSDVPKDTFALDALCDDLNTPEALARLKSIERQLYAAIRDNSDKAKGHKAALLEAGDLLGILQHKPSEWLAQDEDAGDVDVAKIEKLLVERTEVKKAKNFARADQIRDELAAMGIAIIDTPEGPKWKKAG